MKTSRDPIKSEALPGGGIKYYYSDGSTLSLSARQVRQTERIGRLCPSSPDKGFIKRRVTGGKL